MGCVFQSATALLYADIQSSEAPITSPTTKKRRLEENQDKLQDAAANLLAAAAAVAVEVAEGENM